MTNEPSPRPWQVIKMYGLDEDDVRVYVADAHNSAIARIVAYAENDEANAALIVDAVNERDRLRDIVRRLVNQFGNLTSYEDDAAVLREARAAIGEDAR